MRRKLFVVFLLLSLAQCLHAASYNVSTPTPITLRTGECVPLITSTDGTPVATGFKSQEFQVVARDPGPLGQSPQSVRFELIWSGNPGAFNLQIQDAEVDADGNYVTLPTAGTITTSPATAGGAFVSRVELSPWAANFGRIYVNTQAANAVTLTARVCR